ncbi:putative bifunctional diguanylate cyclase/phosphodiesterase [Arcobacter sp. FWKO B]|uniref:putative bifunctional diguanylate cyclase/phosphodiesterase n=1 Tax=Arcobacter sp. FWKO B TaxID=2593672 RepID=UPI0018A51A5A|nr:bifunctional diguanylate cyclase/phosphodiesterase [Arcobacter sp. FWKO B]QOG13197.1 bifunctional diguanylate cyclase/phosphodiesterase [Arcobacter sp. FWKO B]
MFRTLKNFIFSINVALVTILFIIIFIFATYLHTTFTQKEAVKQANIISNQVFSSMYQVMKRGWSRSELNDFTFSLKQNFTDTNYDINIYRGDGVNQLFGFINESAKDKYISQAFIDGEQITLYENGILRNIKPITANNECLKCHTNANIGDTLGVIDITQDMSEELFKMVIDYILFFLIIVPLFVLISYFSAKYTIKRISKSLGRFNSKVIAINTMKDFKSFNTKEIDLGFDELNMILHNVDTLAAKLKNIAVDKELLEFEVQLLDKFIITSDIIKDWKLHISELLVDINKVMETYSLMTIFRIGDDRFEVDIFWYGIPDKRLMQSIEDYIFHSINTNIYLGEIIDPIIKHNITDHNRCITYNIVKTLEHQTKTLFLDTPKIGGIVGISVQSDIVTDPIKNIVIDSILTTLANLVGSIKAINKYTHDLEYYAAHDPLTDLFNQRVFHDMLTYEFKRAQRHQYAFGLMFIDCDNFKLVNDRYGHAFGDSFLQSLASLLQKEKRDEDILARYGGDEFTILLPECDLNGAVTSANRIIKAIENLEISTTDNTVVKITVSIGIAIYPDHASSQKELFMIADNMMYKAKEFGKNTIKIPTENDILSIIKEQKEKSSMLLEAISNNNIVPFFQPIQDSSDNSINIYELLMRIEIDGHLSVAADFIEIAEGMSLIHRMDLMVIENAFIKLSKNQYNGLLFINLSPKSLVIDSYIKNIEELIIKYKINKEKIVFEITERETVKNFSLLEKFVLNLKFEGFKFAIDDFGSGFSSFHYIKRFPIDYLKIDGDFIVNINKDKKDKAFVQSIVTLAKELNIKTIAEFVEDEDIVTTLKELGVDYLQGYHIGKPSRDFI